jgi:hypothetical protein
MLPRHDQRGLAIASNDNGLFAAFRWGRIAPNPNIAGVAVAITDSIALHYVADGVLMMTRPTPLVSKQVRAGVCLCRRARR